MNKADEDALIAREAAGRMGPGTPLSEVKELLKTLVGMEQFDRDRVITIMSKSLKITIPRLMAFYMTVKDAEQKDAADDPTT